MVGGSTLPQQKGWGGGVHTMIEEVFYFENTIFARSPEYQVSGKWCSREYSFRAFSSSLLHVIITCNHLPFFKIFSNFVYICPNFQIFCLSPPFFTFYALFLKNRMHALTFWNTPWAYILNIGFLYFFKPNAVYIYIYIWSFSEVVAVLCTTKSHPL